MKFNINTSSFILFLVVSLVTSCTKEYATIDTEDEKVIQEYIQKNGLTVQQYGTTGIYYQIIKPGLGDPVQNADKVFLTYTVKSTDGKYSSTNEYTNLYNDYLGYLGPADGRSSSYPAALRTIIKDVLGKKGGSVRIIVPSRLAYGKSGQGSIPGNACLDYTVNVTSASTQYEFDEYLVRKFGAENNISIEKDENGLLYHIIQPGTGTEVLRDTTQVTTYYTLKYLDGTLIQTANADSPFTFRLNDAGIIAGYPIGVKKLKKGGKIRMFTPAGLGYTPAAASDNGLRPYAVLDYEVELADVKQ